jgi:hypothetical protein
MGQSEKKEMELISPYNIKKVLFQRNYPGYIYRKELVDDTDYGGDGHLEMVNCYSVDTGHWIGNAKIARMLCKKYGLRNIQKIKPEHCVCSIGFNKEEQKWYGWSHRAIFGFGVGSTCKKGDCGYIPFDEKDAIDDGIRFWSNKNHINVKAEKKTEEEGHPGVRITWGYSKDVSNKKLIGTTNGTFWTFPDTYGKGEWTATTLEEAKQMAIDFSEGIS